MNAAEARAYADPIQMKSAPPMSSTIVGKAVPTLASSRALRKTEMQVATARSSSGCGSSPFRRETYERLARSEGAFSNCDRRRLVLRGPHRRQVEQDQIRGALGWSLSGVKTNHSAPLPGLCRATKGGVAERSDHKMKKDMDNA